MPRSWPDIPHSSASLASLAHWLTHCICCGSVLSSVYFGFFLRGGGGGGGGGGGLPMFLSGYVTLTTLFPTYIAFLSELKVNQ